MISAALLALVTLGSPAAPATAPLSGALAGETIAHMKGHVAVRPASDGQAGRAAPAICHPDPGKGRACRHHVAKQEEKAVARGEMLAQRD